MRVTVSHNTILMEWKTYRDQLYTIVNKEPYYQLLALIQEGCIRPKLTKPILRINRKTIIFFDVISEESINFFGLLPNSYLATVFSSLWNTCTYKVEVIGQHRAQSQ